MRGINMDCRAKKGRLKFLLNMVTRRRPRTLLLSMWRSENTRSFTWITGTARRS